MLEMFSKSKLIKTKLDIYFKKEINKLNKIKIPKDKENENKKMGGGGSNPPPSSSTHIF